MPHAIEGKDETVCVGLRTASSHRHANQTDRFFVRAAGGRDSKVCAEALAHTLGHGDCDWLRDGTVAGEQLFGYA